MSEEPEQKRAKVVVKRCFVPNCHNTTINSENKIFFSLPKNATLRGNWLLAIEEATGVKKAITSNASGYYCCENHFDLETDVLRWKKYKYCLGSTEMELKLKPDSIPSKFEDINLRRNDPVAEVTGVQSTENSINTSSQETTHEVSGSMSTHAIPIKIGVDASTQTEFGPDLGRNINIPYQATTNISYPANNSITNITSGIDNETISSSQSSQQSQVMSEYLPPSQETCTNSESFIESDAEDIDIKIFEGNCRKITNEIIVRNPKSFLGIEEEKIFIVELLANNVKTKNSERNVYITLRKIKLNESFGILSCYFSLSAFHISSIFIKTLPNLAGCLKQLVFRPSKEICLANLPVAFRVNFSETREIIDCFEIEIQKPGNPVHQSLTWSEYKKCNTIKYLIASTPDGFVTYVSEGFGGKISDVALIRECGYLETLEPNMVVMADRGFKHIDIDLEGINCKLLRPPSVPSGEILSKEDSLFAKQIAALRIHIERVIGRIREFSLLKPHSCVDSKLVCILDEAVLSAAGLINMQKKLIKC